MSPDGALLAAGGSNDPTLKIYKAKDGSLVHSVDSGSGGIYTTYFDAMGKNVVISTSNGPLKVIDVATGKLNVIDATIGYVQNVDFSRDGRYMCGPARGKIVIWDARTWTEVKKLDGNQGGTTYAAFSPDGRHVASTGSDGFVKIWDVETGKNVNSLGAGLVSSRLKFTTDGASLVVAGNDGTIRIFGMSKGGRPKPISSKHQEPTDDQDQD